MTEQLTAWAIEHGALGLFVLAFLAATILPFSSEVALAGVMAAGVSPWEAVVAASLGNCLACTLNYGLGWFVREKMLRKLEDSRMGRVALRWMDRWGLWSLFFSWLPAVGDPLTIVAGVVRVPWYWFVGIVFTTRTIRYIVLAALLAG